MTSFYDLFIEYRNDFADMDAVLGDAQIIDMSAESAERRLYIKVRFPRLVSEKTLDKISEIIKDSGQRKTCLWQTDFLLTANMIFPKMKSK